MESVLYQRIKQLCNREGISISKLEMELGFGNSSIKKWEKNSSPSIDYLMGRTDIESSISDIFGDEEIISFQRARQKMTPKDRERMMQMLKLGFEYAFSEENK